jgi:hypothetical protein
VEYTVGGEFTVGLLLEHVQLAMQLCQNAHRYKMLVDTRQLQGALSIAQRYSLVSQLTYFGDYRVQAAVVGLHE